MTSRVASTALIAVVAIGLFASPASAKKFRWKLNKGDAYQVNMVQNMNQKMNVMGQEIEVPNDMNMKMSWTVTDVDSDGNITLTQKIDVMKMKMDAPGMSIEFDSTQDQEPEGLGGMIAGMLKPMIGQAIVQKMTPRGEVLETKIPEKALAGVKNNPLLGQMFSEDQFKEMVSKGVPTFPEEDIDAGFSWSTDAEVKSDAGTMKLKNTYKYAGEVDMNGTKLDKFDVTTQIQFEGGGALGAQIKVTDQDNQGTIYFDSNKGLFVKSEMTQKMTMAISVAGQNIDQQMTTTVKMDLTPASAN